MGIHYNALPFLKLQLEKVSIKTHLKKKKNHLNEDSQQHSLQPPHTQLLQNKYGQLVKRDIFQLLQSISYISATILFFNPKAQDEPTVTF